jgi:putative hydrolase of the HAD superfamily
MMKIVFDFGGVLLRWQPLEFLPRLLPRRAVTPQATADWMRAVFQGFGGDWGEFDRGVVDAAELADRIAARTGLELSEARHLIDSIPSELQPLPETVALLRRLRAAGRELYFLSNMPEPYARHIEASHDFVGLFKRGIYSARVQLLKPQPEIFAHAHREFEVGPASAVFVDDVLKNVQAAREAGWHAIHFLDARQCESELAALGAL